MQPSQEISGNKPQLVSSREEIEQAPRLATVPETSVLQRIDLPHPCQKFTVSLGPGPQSIQFQLPEGQYMAQVQIIQDTASGGVTFQFSADSNTVLDDTRSNTSEPTIQLKDGKQQIAQEHLAKLGKLFSEDLELGELDSKQMKLNTLTKAEYAELISDTPDLLGIVNADNLLRLLEFSGFADNEALNQACVQALYNQAMQFNPSEDTSFRKLIIDIAKQENNNGGVNNGEVKGYHYSKNLTAENQLEREQKVALLDCMMILAFPEASNDEILRCKASLLTDAPNFSFSAIPEAGNSKFASALLTAFRMGVTPVFEQLIEQDKPLASSCLDSSYLPAPLYTNHKQDRRPLYMLNTRTPLFSSHVCKVIEKVFGKRRVHQVINRGAKFYNFNDEPKSLDFFKELVEHGLKPNRVYTVTIHDGGPPFRTFTPLEAAVRTDNQPLLNAALAAKADTDITNSYYDGNETSIDVAANIDNTEMLKALLEFRKEQDKPNTGFGDLLPKIAKSHTLNDMQTIIQLILPRQATRTMVAASPLSETMLSLAQREVSSEEQATKEDVLNLLLSYQPSISSKMSKSIYRALDRTSASTAVRDQFNAPTLQPIRGLRNLLG